MNWKSFLQSLVIYAIIALILFGSGFWVGRATHTCPQIDTTFVDITDTLWLASDTTFIVRETEVSPQISVDSAVTLKIDTMFVSDKDTISVYGLVDYWLDHNVFDWYMEIEHKDFDLHTIDTVFADIIKTVTVVEPVPSYHISTFSLVLVILALTLGLIF